jgi:predicted ATPase
VAERLKDPELLAYGHFNVGDTLLWFGELAIARSHLEQAITLYDPRRGREAAFRCGFNCASNSYLFLARILWHLGYPDRALRCSQQAIAIAQEVSHPFSLAAALSWAAALHQLRRESGPTLEVAEADLALTTEQIIPFFSAQGMVLRGWALVAQGRCEGIARLRDGVDAYRATGATLESSQWLALLAEAYRDTGQPEQGLHMISEALDHVAQTGIVYYEPELHRLEGELRFRLDQVASQQVEANFRQALEIASQQQARSTPPVFAESLRPPRSYTLHPLDRPDQRPATRRPT